ncbi:MAG: SGNH hydrolase domain-containing protein [Cocleimonas sp.]
MKYKNKPSLLTAVTLALLTTFSSATSANQLRDQLVKAADIKTSGKYVRLGFLDATKSPVNPTAAKKALIIGDSHAQDFFNSVVENNYLQNYQISTRNIPTRCQVYLGNSLSEYVATKDTVFCEKSDSLKKASPQIADSEIIILVANWTEWSANKLPQTIENMHLKDDQKLFVIGRKSFGKVSIRKYLRLPEEKLQKLRNTPDSEQEKISTIMHETLKDGMFIDLQKLTCDKDGRCPVFTKELKLISFDGGHLTKDGALHIGQLVFKNSQLGKL